MRLAPLFDFAPMRLAVEGIARSTRWAAMRETHRDTAPDWFEVCLAVFPDSPSDALGLLDEISGFAERILSLGDLNDFGIRDDVSKRAAANLIPVCEGVLEALKRRHELVATRNSPCLK